MILKILLIILSVSAVYADVTGNWVTDWRNEYTAATCPPKSFTIQESNGVYTFDYTALPNCDSGTSVNLTQHLPNTWSWTDADAYIYTVTYNPTNDTILYDFVNVILLYDRNGSYISKNLFQLASYGNWLNPQPMSNSTAACYPPKNITIVYSTAEYSDTERFVMVNGSQNSYLAYQLIINDYAELTWQGQYTMTFSYDYSANQTYLQLSYKEHTSTCLYSYTKLNGVLVGTWYSDWQNALQIMTSARVTSEDNLAMIMTIDTNTPADSTDSSDDGSSTVPFFQLAAPNLYQVGFQVNFPISLSTDAYDEADLFAFKYDPTADVLVAQAVSYSGEGNLKTVDYLLTRNGSILSPEPFYGNWSNPQPVNSSHKASCCVPYYLTFSNRTDYSDNTDYSDYNMIVTTHISHENSSIEYCRSMNGTQTTLSIPNPSPYQLIWADVDDFQVYSAIYFTEPSQTSQITITTGSTDYLSQCTFTLSRGNPIPPPTPTPNPNPHPPTPNKSFNNSINVLLLGLIALLILS